MTHDQSFDVVIVGGGVIGSSIAFFLAEEPAFSGTLAVIEKDPSYTEGSTGRSVGGVRQQFSISENIEISKYGAEFFRSVPQRLATRTQTPDLSFREEGYLFLATDQGHRALVENHRLQLAHGVKVELHEQASLAQRYPWLRTDDLAAGALGLEGEGWIDPFSLLMAFKSKATELGVTFLNEEVVGAQQEKGQVRALRLRSGGVVVAGQIVNATGPRAAELASMVGIPDCPVTSRKRLVFTFSCPTELLGCPMVVDPGGLYFRPEGDKFLCGLSPDAGEDPECHDFRIGRNFFEETLWPALAYRVPAFDVLEEGAAWAGHYAVNDLDHNAILGPHPEVRNFYFANGFSGHGLQQSPAVGRALCELIAFGEYRSLDLHRFSFERFASGQLITERNVI